MLNPLFKDYKGNEGTKTKQERECAPCPTLKLPQVKTHKENHGPGPPTLALISQTNTTPHQTSYCRTGMAANGHVRATEKVIAVNEDEELRRRGFNMGATLGEGSYAKVKCAFWIQINKRVAIKIINKKKAPKDFQTRFLPRELDVMKRVKHPNLIELYDILHLNGKVYLIMEMAGHGDLLEYIKLRGAIPEEKAKGMYIQLSHAISYLHQKDIVHRDLKCENILLDVKNQVKVSDFGFARRVIDDELSSTFCGSAAYAAPEILQGIPYVGKAYDIWSMGVILYIMVAGSMPYDDSNIKKMIRYQTERKVGFSKSRPMTPEVKYLIHHMLEAKVHARYSIDQVINNPWLDAVRPALPEITPMVPLHNELHNERPDATPMEVDQPSTPRDAGHHHHHHKTHSKCKHSSGSSRHRAESRAERDKQVSGGRASEMGGYSPAPRAPPTPHPSARPKCPAKDPTARCRTPAGTDCTPVPTAQVTSENERSSSPRVPPLSNMVAHQEPRDRVWRTDVQR